jgi:hypothetical protein
MSSSKVVQARVVNLIERIHFPRRNALNVAKLVTSPLIARTKMKIILARRKSLKARRYYSRSTTRKKWQGLLC